MPVSSVTEHWIKPDAITINLNQFGDPDYLQVSVLAGAVVMAFKQDVIAYNAAHNYRTWPLQAANTYLETNSAYNVYARLTRSEMNASALIVYDPILRDIEGRPISLSEDGTEILGESDPAYFYVFLGQISGSLDNNGNKKEREWLRVIQYGSLDSSEQKNDFGLQWEKLFKPHYDDPADPEKISWIEAKANMGIQGSVSMFIKGDNINVPTIAEGLPFDNRTIWFNPTTGQIEVIGGTGGDAGGGVTDSVAWGNVLGKPSWITDTIPTIEISGTSVPLFGSISQLSLRTALGLGSNAYTSTAYLPLTGGTLSNYTETPLILKGTYSDNVLLHLHNKSNIATSIGKYGAYTFLANYANGNGTGELEIHDDGRLTYATGGNNYSIWHEGNFTPSNYLPLSGGILENANGSPLRINSTHQAGSAIVFLHDGADKAWFGYDKNVGRTYMYNTASQSYLGVRDNGIPYFNSYTLWHNGNDGSESGLDADLLDGKHLSDILASNVASATKLQTTRYIWGRSFDGTGNITGDLEMGNNIILKQRDTAGNSLHTIYTSTSNNLVIGNGHAVKGYKTYLDGNTLFFRYGTTPSIGMILNSSGNLTVGSSDLASTSAKLYVDGLTKITSSTNIGLQIDSSYKGEVTRGVQVLNPSMPFGDSNGVVLLFGKSTSAYNCGNIAYRHHGENSTNNYVSLGLYGKDNILVCKANGNVGIDWLNPTAKLHVNGDILATGGITMYSARKLKNIQDERGLSLEELSVIKPTRFTWKDSRDSKIHIGGIADDVQKVLPEVIYKTGEDDTLTMDYGNAAFAIAASLIKPVVNHEERIKVLEEENKRLKREIEQLKWNIA